MLPILAVILLLAPPPIVLTPTASEHNARAMLFYAEGRLDLAVEEFVAAYRAMPDVRRQRAGRETLMGALRATLLAMHQDSGAPAPLCRLQGLLRAHAEALSAAYPDEPNMLETRSAHARHAEVTQQLAEFGPNACTPPRGGPPAPPPTTGNQTGNRTIRQTDDPPNGQSSGGATGQPVDHATDRSAVPTPGAQTGADDPRSRNLRIVGGTVLGLGAVLAGAMTYGLLAELGNRRSADAIDRGAAGRPLTLLEYDALLAHRSDALIGRRIALGTGIAAAVTAAVGTSLFVIAQRRGAAPRRWAAAPWWGSHTAGLTVQVALGGR